MINTWRLGWQPKSSRVLTTCRWPLLTAMCNGVCLRLFLAFKSAPPLCSTSMTEPSSPKAAWCTARSPSLSWVQWHTHIKNQCCVCEWNSTLFSYYVTCFEMSCDEFVKNKTLNIPTSASRSTLCLSSSFRTSTWPFWLAACIAVCPAHCPFTYKYIKSQCKNECTCQCHVSHLDACLLN